MTHDRPEIGSVQDMTFALAQERIADLRASVTTLEHEPATRDATTSPGIVTRTRDAVGRRLIALGGSVVADEALRRRAGRRCGSARAGTSGPARARGRACGAPW